MQTKNVNYKLRKLNGDVLTPITLFLRLEGVKKFLLESSMKHNEQGRYSFIGVNPLTEIVGVGDQTKVINSDGLVLKEESGLPLNILRTALPELTLDLPFPFYGGAVGYVGYDAIRQYKEIGVELEDEIDMPDVHFMIYQDVVVFDHLAQSIYLLAIDLEGNRSEEELDERLEELQKQISRKETDESLIDCSIDFQPQMQKEEFVRRIEMAQEYVKNGEILQVVLSQRMIGKVETDPFHFYRVLRNSNPSPYMFYLDFDEYVVLGASPESFIKTNGRQASTNPIAGTRRRGETSEEDQRLAAELMADEKELSEHRMLVDLSREDMSEICSPESIDVKKYMKLEYYRHVMHIVSEVEGMLADGRTGIDALVACLPAGTVSGAPKTRAMQIINELEEAKRGVYAGAIGYVNANGDIDFALAIRSLVIKEQKAYLQAGAGIVVDSVPEREYMETINKARALLSPKIK
ncbi:anthranilate synthase component I [Lederbergia lenta]|uniref:Anthranilate synthase component 1 n=1 Tax=Lederbergia lenta TaxID=1467 RepID=A0A2X4W114_LEDLE|nr:anthranilate synthase component I [Lederbergia lenta]MEC2323573.1 anthranilate synthase component I [Lederbergia lenta]SQI52582.1 anthranilate synthase component I [Lederbergia lenta]